MGFKSESVLYIQEIITQVDEHEGELPDERKRKIHNRARRVTTY